MLLLWCLVEKGLLRGYPYFVAMVRMKGLEPPYLSSAPDPKSGASTISATSAKLDQYYFLVKVIYLCNIIERMKLSVFSKEEQKNILRQYRRLLRHASPVLKRGDVQRIRQAFELSLEAHKDMRRKSGEPYIFHPLSVAEICITEIGLGSTSLISALLHDVVEDTQYTLDDIKRAFGETIGEIVDGLTKMSGSFTRHSAVQAENLRKILLTISKDARVILIKIADRLHNMRTLSSLTRNQQLRIASETIYLYAPVAHRLGLYNIKTELEDLYLKHTEPETYGEIAQKINETRRSRARFIRNFITPLETRIQAEGIGATFKGRPKSIHSIWHKMKRQGISFEEVYDLFAIRIITDVPLEQEKALCWKVYSIITDTYTPNPERLKDWISSPKANGYESLHTTVMSQSGKWVEVQIRSRRMDELAEKGYAAHWKYKGQSDDYLDQSFSQVIDKLRDVLESRSEGDAVEFLQDFRAELSENHIYVFTPKGDLRILPSGSSVLDFAFDIHTELGKHCIGAKVDHKLFPITHQINNGDQIEIISSEKQFPKADWLKIVVSSKGISSIKQFLRHQQNTQIEKGKEELKEISQKQSISLDTDALRLLTHSFGLKQTTELYNEIGQGHIPSNKFNELGNLLSQLQAHQKPEQKPEQSASFSHNKDHILLIGDTSDRLHKMALCCNPIPGDEVFGFVKSNQEIKIHRTTCRHASKLLSQQGDRVMHAQWSSSMPKQFLATIQIKGTNRIGIVHDVMRFISNQEKVDTKSFQIGSDQGIFFGDIHIFVEDINHLRHLIEHIKKINGVTHVVRTDA